MTGMGINTVHIVISESTTAFKKALDEHWSMCPDKYLYIWANFCALYFFEKNGFA